MTLLELKKIAEDASKSWYSGGGTIKDFLFKDLELDRIESIHRGTFHPTTVLALISALERAQEALKWYSNVEIKGEEWFFKTREESRWQNVWNKAREALADIEKIFDRI